MEADMVEVVVALVVFVVGGTALFLLVDEM
jgi:hypothetical protein